MEKIIDYRGTGKTRKLMQVAKDTDAFFVCKNPEVMLQKSYAYGLMGVKCLSYDDFIQNMKDYDKVVIDDLDVFVTTEFKGHMVGFSLCSCN